MPRYAQAVLKVFVDLYEKGYIYRDRYLVNWDPGSRSAISDLEVEDREVTDTLYYVDYPLASGSGSITVATVRPETMLADVAIAVNPEDERYQRLIGETAVLPIVGRKLKIIADDYVKTDFGTGALKITPGHDPNDFEIGNRHGLPHPTVIGEDGCMEGDEVPERFLGLTTAQAQAAIVAELDALGLIATPRAVHAHRPAQPALRQPHRAADLAAVVHAHGRARQARDRGRQARRDPLPPRGPDKVYLNWMENIRPWCISRQLWWGHQTPGVVPPQRDLRRHHRARR